MRLERRTEECLLFLLWCADTIRYPRLNSVFETFEGWAYGRGLRQQLRRLERDQLIERDAADPASGILRLTESGRRRALGGKDAESRWSRDWDGRWRVVVFDVPRRETPVRNRLRYWLRRQGFGRLQGSVWITPDELTGHVGFDGLAASDARALVWFEGRPCGGESDSDLVAGAWDIPGINRGYRRYLDVLEAMPPAQEESGELSPRVRRWLRSEAVAWREAVSGDPLLPTALHPRAYLGVRAWNQRREILASYFGELRELGRSREMLIGG